MFKKFAMLLTPFLLLPLGTLLTPAAVYASTNSVFAGTKSCQSGSSQVAPIPIYGGKIYCGYYSWVAELGGTTEQVFGIGTDFSVWTRWQTNGHFSNWVSLGGKIRHTYRTSI